MIKTTAATLAIVKKMPRLLERAAGGVRASPTGRSHQEKSSLMPQ